MVAKFFGVRDDTVRGEWKLAGLPIRDDGKYDLSEIYRWRQGRKQMRERDGDQNVADAEVARRKELAEMLKAEEDHRAKKMNNDKAAGEVLDRAEVRREIVEWSVRLRTRLQSLVDRLVAIVPGAMKPTVKRVAHETIRIAMKEALDTPIADEPITEMILAEAERLRECDPVSS